MLQYVLHLSIIPQSNYSSDKTMHNYEQCTLYNNDQFFKCTNGSVDTIELVLLIDNGNRY